MHVVVLLNQNEIARWCGSKQDSEMKLGEVLTIEQGQEAKPRGFKIAHAWSAEDTEELMHGKNGEGERRRRKKRGK